MFLDFIIFDIFLCTQNYFKSYVNFLETWKQNYIYINLYVLQVAQFDRVWKVFVMKDCKLDRIFLFITINFSNINQWFQKHVCHWDIRMYNITRSRRSEAFRKKDVSKNFAKFTGNHLCRRCHTRNLNKKETLTQVFSCLFMEHL